MKSTPGQIIYKQWLLIMEFQLDLELADSFSMAKMRNNTIKEKGGEAKVRSRKEDWNLKRVKINDAFFCHCGHVHVMFLFE